MLSVIPKDRDGRRDFALVAALLITGLRVGQVRAWKASKIRCSGGSARIMNWNIPTVVCEALQTTLSLMGTHVYATCPCQKSWGILLFSRLPKISEGGRRMGAIARLAISP
jgi:hypothetical protein